MQQSIKSLVDLLAISCDDGGTQGDCAAAQPLRHRHSEGCCAVYKSCRDVAALAGCGGTASTEANEYTVGICQLMVHESLDKATRASSTR